MFRLLFASSLAPASRRLQAEFGQQHNGGMARKEVYCEDCGSYQPLIEHPPQKDAVNPYPWYDITCATCCSIIPTVKIVPDDKPLEPVEPAPKIRPLPKPPRCRGIPLGDGNYTGCAYGYGDVAPFSPPCDCPICNGSGLEAGFEAN